MKSLIEPSIYLASKSPRRRELLNQIGVPHAVISADVEEKPRHNESSQQYVQRLAREKAEAGLASLLTNGRNSSERNNNFSLKPALGADTIVVSNGDILEKPCDAHHAATMLRQLSGSTHQVMTAVALATDVKTVVKLSTTDVVFRVLQESEIRDYWTTGEPQDKAGGYGIQGLGAVFVEQIRGSYSGVVGLPIEQTVELLMEFNVRWWQQV